LQSLVKGRLKRRLGDAFGLTNFGVNLTQLKPGAVSSVRHNHYTNRMNSSTSSRATPTLVTDQGPTALKPGMCADSRRAATMRTISGTTRPEDVWYLEVGDRIPGDSAAYPERRPRG
jgi:uncharacterized cupin superfamily protein